MRLALYFLDESMHPKLPQGKTHGCRNITWAHQENQWDYA